MGAFDIRPLGETLGREMVTRAAPAVTVLMAVYDPPVAMLRQAVESVLNQTYRDLEFLIVDDGSQDQGVRDFLARQAAADGRIRVAWEPHRGLTSALNRGLALARTCWIARQDADDWSEPSRLERQVVWFRAFPRTTVLGTSAWTHQQDGQPLWRLRLPRTHAAILAAFPRGNPFVHGSAMFPRAAAEAAGGYREEFPCSQDYDFFWRLAERGSAANLGESLYHYRYTCSSVSAGRGAEQARAHRAIQELGTARQRGEVEDVGRALRNAETEISTGASRAFLRAALKQADHRMLAGDYQGAWVAYRELLGSHPGNTAVWAKIGRLGMFRAFPCFREISFR